MVVTSILIPRFENIMVKPINFVRCAKPWIMMIRMKVPYYSRYSVI